MEPQAYPRRIVVDLETVPIAEAATYLEPPTPPANYKHADTIAAWRAEAVARQLAKAALDPDLCRIVALACHDPQAASLHTWLAPDEADERHALTEFWQVAGRQVLVGFNIRAFDLPVLLRRSWYLHVEAPTFTLSRYRSPQVVDLLQRLTYEGLLQPHSLDFYVKRLGLAAPADPIDGAEIGACVARGDWEAVQHHCETDVLKTLRQAERLGELKARPDEHVVGEHTHAAQGL